MRLKLFVFALVVTISHYNGSAQTIKADSIIKIITNRLQQRYSDFSFYKNFGIQYGKAFYIEDVATRRPIAEGRYGIYEFGIYGDDLDCWIMWYDASGYKIYTQPLNTEMLGEILEFCNRNHLSATESYYNIVGLYNSALNCESVGEKEIIN